MSVLPTQLGLESHVKVSLETTVVRGTVKKGNSVSFIYS